jgi:hypothetical protein
MMKALYKQGAWREGMNEVLLEALRGVCNLAHRCEPRCYLRYIISLSYSGRARALTWPRVVEGRRWR